MPNVRSLLEEFEMLSPKASQLDLDVGGENSRSIQLKFTGSMKSVELGI